MIKKYNPSFVVFILRFEYFEKMNVNERISLSKSCFFPAICLFNKLKRRKLYSTTMHHAYFHKNAITQSPLWLIGKIKKQKIYKFSYNTNCVFIVYFSIVF